RLRRQGSPPWRVGSATSPFHCPVEHGHADPEAVASLTEVGGPWVAIDQGIDLPYPRQWMHHDGVFRQAIHQVDGQDVDAAIALVFVGRREALGLDPRLVQDIKARERALEI